MHFPSIPRCFGILMYFILFSYKMTLRKASDVTHFVEEIPQGIDMQGYVLHSHTLPFLLMQ